jgi:hypothetical protein
VMAANHFGDDVTDLVLIGAVAMGAYLLWSKYANSANASMGGTDFGTDTSAGGSSWGADASSAPSDVTVSFPGG